MNITLDRDEVERILTDWLTKNNPVSDPLPAAKPWRLDTLSQHQAVLSNSPTAVAAAAPEPVRRRRRRKTDDQPTLPLVLSAGVASSAAYPNSVTLIASDTLSASPLEDEAEVEDAAPWPGT